MVLIMATIGLKHGQRMIIAENEDNIFRTGCYDDVIGFVGDDGYIPTKGIVEWHTLPLDLGWRY